MARRPFFDTLREVRSGEVIDDLAEKLQELVQAVQRTGAGGSLSFKLDVKPMKGSTEAGVNTDDIKLKKPELRSTGTVMFPSVEGNLTRSHPRQDDLPGITLAADNPTAANGR